MQIKVSDLKPGDIIPANNNPAASHGLTLPRMAVLRTDPSHERGKITVTVSHLDGSGIGHGYAWAAESTLDVERAQEMNNAQKKADLLLGAVKKAVGIMSAPGLGQYTQLQEEWLKPAKILISQIEPPPPPAPTLTEAFAALDELAEGARKVQSGEWDKHTMQFDRNKVRDLLNRARAAGVLK